MLKPIYSLILVLAAGCLLPAAGQTPVAACNLVPGWTQTGPDRTYVSDNLFEYMTETRKATSFTAF